MLIGYMRVGKADGRDRRYLVMPGGDKLLAVQARRSPATVLQSLARMPG